MENIKVIEPAQIGPYKLRGTVGDGAFSVVKLVKHVETNQYFACKIVPKARLNTAHLVERFEIEIRIAQQMHHPGVVQLHDLLKDENNYYVIMEFCPNGELFQFIVDRNRLSEFEAKPILRQMLEGLEYIHSKGVSHRDLKPENLLIDSMGRIKISDFGLSRFIDKNGLVKTPCGSPCYASPECISGRAYNGKTTDVWSLGVILYAMLTGQLPWTKRNQAQLFKQIKTGDYTIPEELSADATSIIMGMMTVDPEKRLTISQCLEHPFLANINEQYQVPFSINHHINIRKVDIFFDNEVSMPEFDNIECDDTSSPNFTLTKTSKMITASNLPRIISRTGSDRKRNENDRYLQVIKKAKTKKNGPLRSIGRSSLKPAVRASVTKPKTLTKKIINV
jgi:5'-AMP-activated protein kinase catalytic alpha subunit